MEMVTRTLLHVEPCDHDWPPENVLEFSVWLQGHLQDIPAEHRSSAEIEIDAGGGDDCYATISITYESPETPEEKHRRVHRAEAVRAAVADGWRQRPWGDPPDKYYPPFNGAA